MSSISDLSKRALDSMSALALVFDPTSAGRLILVEDASRLHLPQIAVPQRFYPEVEDFARGALTDHGIALDVLKCLDDGDSRRDRPRLYSALAHTDDAPNDFVWADLDAQRSSIELSDAQLDLARRESIRLRSGLTESPSASWQWSGSWRNEIECWVRDSLSGWEEDTAIEMTQIRSWSISTVYRVVAQSANTRRSERFYFKSAPTFFGSEVDITLAVAERFPDISPRIIAADAPANRMLMEDLGNITVGAADSMDIWRDAMQSLARIQLDFAAALDSPALLRLERRATGAVVQALKEWVDSDSSGRPNFHYAAQRTSNALRRLESRIGRIEELCDEIDSLGLPPTLDHGDLDGGNMFVRDGKPVIMDWSDASVSNPLFTPVLVSQVGRHTELADAFLREWADYASLEGLRRGFDAAKAIAALERAFHYHRNIVPYLDSPSVDLRVLEMYIPDLLELAADAVDARK